MNEIILIAATGGGVVRPDSRRGGRVRAGGEGEMRKMNKINRIEDDTKNKMLLYPTSSSSSPVESTLTADCSFNFFSFFSIITF